MRSGDEVPRIFHLGYIHYLYDLQRIYGEGTGEGVSHCISKVAKEYNYGYINREKDNDIDIGRRARNDRYDTWGREVSLKVSRG